MTGMSMRRSGKPAIEWPTVVLAIFCYATWFAVGLFVWPSYPIVALIVLGLVLALQSSLIHEVLHGHPTRNALVNEAFVFFPIGLVWPFRRFKAIRKAWLLHAIGVAVVVPIVIFGFGMPLWLYVLGPVWLGQSLISIRTYAEHQWSEHPEGRTIIVERSPLSFLFLNNNLHFVHHKSPTVAWYKLPKMFRERREEWLRMNNGYVYPNYLALIRSYAFKAKGPIVHPVLRRAPEPGRAFKPRVRARNVNGLGTAPVPAEPPKE
ncbi:MAG: fatty acid desaturase [Mesorhizobium sp.]|nr:fatty acid desaturase [Mesorhizobium sp.]